MADEELQKAMEVLRSRRDPEKLADHARAIAAQRKGKEWTEEQKANLREAQRLRRERERQEREGSELATATAEKRPVGRPRTKSAEATEKRPRGRPKKEAGGQAA